MPALGALSTTEGFLLAIPTHVYLSHDNHNIVYIDFPLCFDNIHFVQQTAGSKSRSREDAAMGGTQAREEELQDDVFPWFHLIQWSAEDASNNRIFHYDLAGAQEAARALTRDTDSFLRLCPSSLPPNSGQLRFRSLPAL